MIKKILLPLDGSAFAEQALPYAEALGRRFGAEIIAVWVLHMLPALAEYEGTAYRAAIRAESDLATAYLGKLGEKWADPPVQLRTLILNHPNPAQAIIDLVGQEQVDVIVMSTHGRSGFSRWVHGSVAAKVLQGASCPVLLVRAQEVPLGSTRFKERVANR